MKLFQIKAPRITNTWTHSLFFISSSFLMNACSVNPNANEAGLFDSISHLSKGTYQYRKDQKSLLKNNLSQQLDKNKQRLYVLNQQLQHKRQQSRKLKKKLQKNKKSLDIKNKELRQMKALYFANKEKKHSLQPKITQLNNHILLEAKKQKKKSRYILSLKKKRDKLRKEILMQTSL